MELLCALLDPRRKALGADQLMNGSAALRNRAEEDLEGVNQLPSLRMHRRSRPLLCRLMARRSTPLVASGGSKLTGAPTRLKAS